MGKIISFSNQKGGVGKTTSAINIAASAAKKKNKVLLIDLDSQGNASSGVGINRKDMKLSSYDVMVGDCSAKDAVVQTKFSNLYLMPSSIDLAGAELELAEEEDRNNILKSALAEIKDEYDYIFIDCSPSLGVLTINALAASDGVIIPMTAEYYSLEGLSQLITTVKQIKKLYNPSLDLTGILITMYDKRLNLSKQVLTEIEKYYSDKLFKTTIARNVRISEAPSFGMPVIYFDKYSKGAIAYDKVTNELLKRV